MERKFKVIGCTSKSLLGTEFTCKCGDINRSVNLEGSTHLGGITHTDFKVISILPSIEEPSIVKFQNSHLTITAKIID